MQLGNILETAADPVALRIVRFPVLGTDKSGNQTSAMAEAALAFVDEAKREEYKQYARDYLDANRTTPAPIDVLGDEIDRWFLMAALRDKDKPACQFCLNENYEQFRSAITRETAAYLMKQHDMFVTDEYPEMTTDEQREELTDQAVGK